ncbi:MAG: hypothetical protein WCI38_01690 [Chthoniobacterales bacterium]
MGLPCRACGFDNDPTRVYCHNCGVRLDREAAPSPAPTGFTHPTEVSKAKVRRAATNWPGLFSLLLKLLVLSGLVAAVYFALLPPLDLPVAAHANKGLARGLDSLIAHSAASSSTRGFSISSADLNVWLVSSVQLHASGGTFSMRPERVYTVPGNGSIRIGLEVALPQAGRTWFEGDFLPVRANGSYIMQPRSYAIGRLPIPLPLGWLVSRQLEGLMEALKDPLDHLAAASKIEVRPDSVSLRWSE